ncbi:MAG TPA: hypothetical protein VGK74_27455 [Symbiobacteriaceae bacterium]
MEFLYTLPIPGPILVQLQGIKDLLPMVQRGGIWALSLDLPEGVYSYRFHVADLVSVNDPRRSTKRQVSGETWSVVQVTEAGPIWVERTLPKLTSVQICRGISEAGIPLVVVERVGASELPVFLWNQIDHVFQNALMQVFLVRPDQELAFGGEFLLEQSKASPHFDLKFWISISLEPSTVMPGIWTFLVQVEGGPVVTKPFRLMT